MKKPVLAAAIVGVLAWPVIPAANATPAPAAAGPVGAGPAAETSDVSAARRTVLRIMPLGDSITYGIGSSTGDGYRYHLQRDLTAAGARFDFVGSQKRGRHGDLDNEGHGGKSTQQIAAHLDGWLTTYRPNVVLLHTGTNNVARGHEPRAIAAKLSAMIDQIHAKVPGAHIFVARIIATRVPGEVAANRAYNALIPGVVAAKGPLVHLVDQTSVGGLSLNDAHHPNDYGYRKIAYNWYRAMRAVLAPYWRPPVDNPYADTRHVKLTHWNQARRRNVSAYWSRIRAVTEDGRPAYVWIRDRNQKP
ncbi:lysophospholipase L1-like esterase [Krasilnikovia cinnamomea]|uniref:Lysophospholipase L1-like esterase n=1 Tax=Krasilnikovia cinnamomea TaxID=349313 RepID=A0A4Q7ZGQ3_9ACTN|nr:SGNH/GDSL hydrolase family protein [Krasilnikovia cinnamomea]RZU49972.1 lysophospholipase L1-like esterase [Krasilnikovia cinnamomea]